MSQFQNFNCVVTGGSITVRAIYDVVVGVVTGSGFTAGETVNYTGGGVGVFASLVSGRFRFYRTSGPEAVVGNVFTGVSSSSTVQITSVVTQNESGIDVNPPRFADSPSQGALVAGASFVVQSAAASGITMQVAGGITRDSFDLTSVWTGLTFTDVPGFLTRDFTPNNGFPLPQPGDGQTASIIATALRKIDTLVPIFGPWKTVVSDAGGYAANWTDASGTGDFTVGWRNESGRIVLRGVAHRTSGTSSPSTIFTLPVGDRPRSRVQFVQASTNIAGSTSIALYIRIEVDGVVSFVGTVSGTMVSEVCLDGIQFTT